MRIKLFLIFALAGLAAGSALCQVAEEFTMPAKDGAGLYTAVLTPKKGGKYPAVIYRTPYAKKTQKLEKVIEAFKRWTDAGYAVVFQHARGSGKSAGVRYPYDDERADGLCLLDWVRAQGFYNGEIYLSGGSYGASVHLSYLDTNPPDVKGAVVLVQDDQRYNVMFHNGFFKMGLHGGWYLREYAKNDPIKRDFDAVKKPRFPLFDLSRRVFGFGVPQFDIPMLHPDPSDPFWLTPAGGGEYRNAIAKAKIPILLVSAFYDIYTGGIIDMWRRVPDEIRAKSAFLITPYQHNINSGVVKFPGGSPREVCPDFEINWFNHIRAGEPLRFIELGKAKWFTLWQNKWHAADDIKNAPNKLEFYLNNGRVLGRSAGARGEISYKFDPQTPASFKGCICYGFGGMQEQDAPNSRPDIISFVSEPFEKEVVAEGAMEVSLKVKSDCLDTCFYVRASIVKANGKTYSLRDGIDSLRRQAKDYQPGGEAVLSFKFEEHSFMFEKGDRLRLDVSSSCANSFSVHTNYPGNHLTESRTRIAENTVITGESRICVFAK